MRQSTVNINGDLDSALLFDMGNDSDEQNKSSIET